MSPVKFTLTVYQQFLFHMWIWRVFHNFNELRIFHKFSRVMNLNLAHSIGNHRCHTAIIVPHNYRLEMGHPRTAGDGAGGEQWRRTRREAGPRKTRNQDGTRIPNMPKGDNIQKRTAFNAIRPSIYEFEVLRGLGGATCPPSLCSFTVEHVRGSPPASQLSSAASVPNFSEFGPMAKSLPPNKLQYSFCFHWPIVQNPFCGANRTTKAFVRGLEMKQHFDTVSKGVRDQHTNQNIDCQEHFSANIKLERRAVVSVNNLWICK